MAWFLWISLSLSFLFLIRIIASNASPSSTGRLPPGPTPLPIIGNLLALGDKPHRSLAALAKDHGPIMALKLGSVTTVVISSSAAAKEALFLKDKAFSSRAVIDAVRIPRFQPTSMVWTTAADQRWRSLRRLCAQMFTPNSLDAGQGLRRQKVQELVRHVLGKGGRAAVDVGRAAFATTINLISNTMFSFDLVDIDAESSQEFRDLVWGVMEEGGKPNLSDFFPVLRPLDLQGIRRRTAERMNKMLDMFDKVIDARLRAMAQGSTSTSDFLDALLRVYDQKEGGEFKLDRPTLRSLLADIFFAGADTSSTTTEWAMAELLHNPDVMAKVRAELAAAISGEVEESDIARLPYLQAVVKETFRLHPTVPLLLPHETESAVELGGYTVPKGARVLVNVWAIGQREDVWPDAGSFLPERFLEGQVDFRGQDFEFIPFGAGRRVCLGLPLATRMVHLMLASMLHSFEWQLPDGMGPDDLDLTEKFGVTMALATPLRAIAVP